MRLKTQLAIKADIEALPPRAWNRKDIELYLAEKRADWNAPKYFTPSLLISFLVENEIARVGEISSQGYGRKTRYVIGDLSVLQFACSFYKNSYVSHATALYVHGLSRPGKIFVNHEQTPKKTTSRLSQARIDQAFRNQPRRSTFEFQVGTHTITFLNGKNTGDAGVIDITGPSGEPLRSTSLERTLIDCVVRPQYAGGIQAVAAALPQAIGRVSAAEICRLLARTKYAYPYHQSLGFLLERAGMPASALEPLRSIPMRFKFYLDYGMKKSVYDPRWQTYYPTDLR
jgi:predicted transcriptional regulator of viral defense system